MSDMDTGDTVSQTNATAEGDTQQNTPNLGAIRKAGEKGVLDVLAKVTGQQFGSTRDAAAFVEQLLSARNTTNAGDAQPKVKETSNRLESTVQELQKQLQNMQSQLAEKDQTVRKTSLQSQIKDAAVKTGFDPSMLDLATSLFEQQIAFDNDGSFYVKGGDGQVKLDANGNPYTLDKLAQEILKSRPKLAAEESRTGTGTKFGVRSSVQGPGGDMPDAATDPEGWKAWKSANGIGVKGQNKFGVTMGRKTLGY
jgi:Tfp pilus assembly protein FimV